MRWPVRLNRSIEVGSAVPHPASSANHARAQTEGDGSGQVVTGRELPPFQVGSLWRFPPFPVPMRKKVQLVRHVTLLLSALLAACKPPPADRHHMPGASAERGREAIERVGCGSCHVIPGISCPTGRVRTEEHTSELTVLMR